MNILSIITTWLLAIIAVESIVEIFVDAEITIKIRSFFMKINPNFLGKLWSCGYCMSVWVSMPIAIFLPINVTNIGLFDIILSIFILHRLSNIFHEGVSRWFKRLPKVIVTQDISQETPQNTSQDTPQVDNIVEVSDGEPNSGLERNTEIQEDSAA